MDTLIRDIDALDVGTKRPKSLGTFAPNVLPEGWHSKRLKDVVTLNPEVLPEDTPAETEILYVDISNVDSSGKVLAPELTTFGEAPSRARRIVRDGDTIISTVRTYLKAIAYMDQPVENLIVSTGFCVLRPKAGVDKRYLAWLLRSEPFIASVVAHSEGVSYPAINPTELGALPVWLPPMDEQRRMADRLDAETARIDGLIEKKHGLICLLRERHYSLTNQALLTGFDGQARRVQSPAMGYPPMPSHWAIKRLRFLFDVAGGHTPSKEKAEYWVGDIPWVTPKDMKRSHILDSEDHLSMAACEETGMILHKPNSILMVVRGMILAKRVPVALTEVPVTINQDMKALRPRKTILPEFARLFFQSINQLMVQSLLEQAGHGTMALRMDRLMDLPVVVPPIVEQEAIVNAIKHDEDRTRLAIDSLSCSIALLKEQRAGHVSAAVTGKGL